MTKGIPGRGPGRARWLALLAALAVALVPRAADGAACCLSATSFGVGRLLVWEDWAVGLQLGHARSLGQWDSGGSLRWSSDLSEGLTTVEPWAIVRVHQRVQLQGWVPILANDRRSGSESQVAGGLGDVGGAARLEVLGIGEYAGVPSLAVTVVGFAPTGKRPEETRPPLFAGTTGRGAWGGSLALESEYALLPWFVKLDGGVTGWLPFRRSDTGATQTYGLLGQASLSAGRELVPDAVVAAVSVTGEWEAPIRIDGARVPDSGAHLYSLAASLSWRFDPHWTVVGSATNTVWPDGGGRNRDARIGFTLGIRHGHF